MDKRESLKWQSRNLRPKEVAESAIVMDVDVGRSISAMSFYKDYVLISVQTSLQADSGRTG